MKFDFTSVIWGGLWVQQDSSVRGVLWLFLNRYSDNGAMFFIIVNALTAFICANLLFGFMVKLDLNMKQVIDGGSFSPSVVLDKFLWGGCWPVISFHLKKQNSRGVDIEYRWRLIFAAVIAFVGFPYAYSVVGHSSVLSLIGWQGVILINSIAFWVLLTESVSLLIINGRIARRA